jgi:hypothetical protein
LLHCSEVVRESVLASDALDLEAGDPEIVELAVREQRQLTDGLAITQISAELREDVRNEHGSS